MNNALKGAFWSDWARFNDELSATIAERVEDEMWKAAIVSTARGLSFSLYSNLNLSLSVELERISR